MTRLLLLALPLLLIGADRVQVGTIETWMVAMDGSRSLVGTIEVYVNRVPTSQPAEPPGIPDCTITVTPTEDLDAIIAGAPDGSVVCLDGTFERTRPILLRRGNLVIRNGTIKGRGFRIDAPVADVWFNGTTFEQVNAPIYALAKVSRVLVRNVSVERSQRGMFFADVDGLVISHSACLETLGPCVEVVAGQDVFIVGHAHGEARVAESAVGKPNVAEWHQLTRRAKLEIMGIGWH